VKTISLKKVAVAAVASLGFGLTSVVPAQAAESAATTFTIMSSSASAVDSASVLTSTLTYASAGLTLTAGGGATPFATTDVGRSVFSDKYGMVGTIASVTSTSVVVLTAAPSASGSGTTTAMADTNTTANWYLGTKASTVVGDGITATSIKGMTVTAGKVAALNLKFNAATNDDVSKARILIGGTVLNTSDLTTIADQNMILAFNTPVAAGTYEAVVQYAIDADFTAVTTVSKPFTLTVVADSAMSADVSTVYLNDDAAAIDTATTSATDALGATGPSTLAAEAAVIWVNVKKANGSTYSGGTLYAYMTGAGMLDIDGSTGVRSESASNDGNHYIMVEGDGTTGVGTVNIYMILADGATKVDLPSKKVSFYGSVAKLEATVVQGIATSGTANGACGGLTDCTYATLAEKPAVLIKATDASGVLVPGLTVNAASADTTVVSSSAVSGATATTDFNGLGYYNASVTGGSVKGKSTTVTYSTTLSSGVVISSNAVTIANAGTPSVVTWATNKATYAAGEKIVITVSAKDSSGNAAADGTYTLFGAATTLGGTFGGSVPGTSVELVGGKKEYTAFAPGTAGTYNLTSGAIAVGAAAGSKLTVDLTVTDGKAALLTQIDALNAKIVALNALIAKIMKKLGVK
jgi:hypothetical protein